MSKKGKVGGFLGGALVGLGLGFLFAPKTGEETRKMLADKTAELWDKVRSMDADEIKDKLENKLKEEKKNYIFHDEYKRGELSQLLINNNIDLVCMFTVWPETYSYTLTEAVLNGLPVIVANVGALGERTTKNNYGWTVNLNNINNEVIDLIKKIANDRTLLEEKKRCLKSIQIKSCIEMTNEYIPLYEKNIKDNFRDNFKFDPEYIYQGYLNANYSYTDNVSNSFSGYNAEIDAIKGELNLLKSSLTYKLLMKITSINFPFKIHFKRILLSIFK